MAKALVLFSGGLDSILAAKVLMAQGVEVTAVAFKSLFFDTEKAKRGAEMIGIKLIELDFTAEHLAMVKKPKYGYGKNMNPCIDCHAMMFRWAGEFLREKSPLTPFAERGRDGYDFLATGEVLGQRPMSQNGKALKMVGDYSGFADILLRPLSAKLLPETQAEREGLVDREKLLDISGRSRERQMLLAKEFGIEEFPSPGGGCLLTDPDYGKRLAELFSNVPDCLPKDVELLRFGRIFWFEGLKGKVLAVIGRNQVENEKLLSLKRDEDVNMDLKNENGPSALVRFFDNKYANNREEFSIISPSEIDVDFLEKKDNSGIINSVAALMGYYAPKTRGREIEISLTHK